MKRRRILLLLALAAVAAALVLFWPRGPKEPLVEGKRITVWLCEMMTNAVAFTNDNTSKTLRASGTNALPFLLHQFSRPRSKWRATWNRWASAVPAGDFRFEDDEKRIAIALWGLYLLGPEAAPALPTLAGYLALGDKEDLGNAAAAIMARVGDQALPWLLNAVASTNPVVAQHAMNGLMRMESESAIQALVGLLLDTNSAVRRIAAENLWKVDAPTRTVPALTAALADPEPEVQSLAAHSLGLIGLGEQASNARPALLRLMTSTNPAVASAASNAVLRIDRGALPPHRP